MEEVFTPIERAALSKRMVYSDFRLHQQIMSCQRQMVTAVG
jgi:hypothetical protein